MFSKEYKKDIEDTLKDIDLIHSCEWDEDKVRVYDKDGNFLEEYEAREAPYSGCLDFESSHLYKNPVYCTATSLTICTIEHVYHLTKKDIIEHDEFIKKHEGCPDCGPHSKIFFYDGDAPDAYCNWLIIKCRSCGEAKRISLGIW